MARFAMLVARYSQWLSSAAVHYSIASLGAAIFLSDDC